MVLNKSAQLIIGQLLLAFFFLHKIANLTGREFFTSSPINIADVKNYSSDSKRDIHSTFDSEDQNDHGLPIDPFDLMNRLKQVGAMDNATTPSDALDEALNAFNESEDKNAPIK